MEAKTNLKTCNKGHRFYKSSDCPVCLICEEERKPYLLRRLDVHWKIMELRRWNNFLSMLRRMF
jgi:hypothetical protein